MSERQPLKGSLLTIHGACEHSGRYAEWKEFAQAAGWQVLTPDLPGHGSNHALLKTHLNQPDEYLRYLAEMVRSSHITPPLVVVGHSLGGLLATLLVQQWAERVQGVDQKLSPAGLVLLSPLFAVAHPIPTWKYVLGKICFNIYPTMRFNTEISGLQLTRDLEKIKLREQDPLIAHSVTAGWFFHVQELIKWGNTQPSNIQIPTLILQSGDDHVVDTAATKNFFNQIPSINKQFHILPEHKHELLNEIDRQQTMQLILNWLDESI